MLRRFLPLFLIVWLQAAPAAAIDPTRYITQYAHTAWRMQDGALNSTPWTIVQTPEGYMWVGTADGILQFDGVHFGRWMPGNGQQLPNSEVLRLRRTRDGSVWISALGVLSRWKGKTLKNYATGSRAGPDALAEDIDGKVWLGKASAPPGANALCRVGDNDLECLGAAEGLPSFHANASLGDRDGTLWVGGDTLLMHWAHGAPTFYRPPGLAANVGTIGIYALAPSTDGGVWWELVKQVRASASSG